jgi:hypothetical protein
LQGLPHKHIKNRNVLIQTQYYSQKLRFNTFSIFESLYTTGPETA